MNPVQWVDCLVITLIRDFYSMITPTYLTARITKMMTCALAITLLWSGFLSVFVSVEARYRFNRSNTSGVAKSKKIKLQPKKVIPPKQFRADVVSHTDQPEQGKLAWRVKTSGQTSSAPAISDSTVYVATNDGVLTAYNRKDGRVIWQQRVDERGIERSSPYLDTANGNVIVGSQSGYVTALNAKTGAGVWRFSAKGPVLSSPTVSGNSVYVGSRDGFVYALDAATGQQRWMFDTKSMVDSTPYVADGHVYVGDYHAWCYSLDAKTGAEEWRHQIDAAVVASAVASDDKVYFPSSVGAVYALDRKTGKKKWMYSASFNQSVYVPVIVRGQETYMSDSEGHITAINNQFGIRNWQIKVDGGILVPPVLAGNTFYVATGTGNVYALDANQEGKILWQANIDSAVESPLVVNQGQLFVGVHTGRLYVYQ